MKWNTVIPESDSNRALVTELITVALVLIYAFRTAAVFRRQSADSDEYFFLRASPRAVAVSLDGPRAVAMDAA